MYERIPTAPAPRPAEPMFPHRSREEELELQLAGHLAALLAVTDELRGLSPSPELDNAAIRISEQVARLRGRRAPLRLAPCSASPGEGRAAALHQQAHTLAGRALVVAASRADTTAAMLACEQMDFHAAALGFAAPDAAKPPART